MEMTAIFLGAGFSAPANSDASQCLKPESDDEVIEMHRYVFVLGRAFVDENVCPHPTHR